MQRLAEIDANVVALEDGTFNVFLEEGSSHSPVLVTSGRGYYKVNLGAFPLSTHMLLSVHLFTLPVLLLGHDTAQGPP